MKFEVSSEGFYSVWICLKLINGEKKIDKLFETEFSENILKT
jgi:hypothetical protein